MVIICYWESNCCSAFLMCAFERKMQVVNVQWIYSTSETLCYHQECGSGPFSVEAKARKIYRFRIGYFT